MAILLFPSAERTELHARCHRVLPDHAFSSPLTGNLLVALCPLGVVFCVQLTEQQLSAALHGKGAAKGKAPPDLLPFLPSALVCALHMTLVHRPFRRMFLAPWVASGCFHAIAAMFPVLRCA